MLLNEVTEVGFYVQPEDALDRTNIYEVLENTDEEWLKEDPEHKLLIDEWTYEYTDEDGIKHYESYGGNLVAVQNAYGFEVVKISDTTYTISGMGGCYLTENKPTRLEIVTKRNARYSQALKDIRNIVDTHDCECSDAIKEILDKCNIADEDECNTASLTSGSKRYGSTEN